MKLAYKKKVEEARKCHAKTTEPLSGLMKTLKLPKFVITKFRGELTDWPHFWGQFEAKINKTNHGVTKYPYPKELLDHKKRPEINDLPFSSDSSDQVKRISYKEIWEDESSSQHLCRTVMPFPTISGTHSMKIHDFLIEVSV